jgi:hypothetical protein
MHEYLMHQLAADRLAELMAEGRRARRRRERRELRADRAGRSEGRARWRLRLQALLAR